MDRHIIHEIARPAHVCHLVNRILRQSVSLSLNLLMAAGLNQSLTTSRCDRCSSPSIWTNVLTPAPF